MDNEIAKDFGKWTTPKSWNDLTLKQFQAIEEYYSDKDKKFDVREVLHLFTDHTVDEINQLPLDFVDKLLNELTWLQEKPEWGEATNKIEVDGVKYIVNVQEKMKTGEYIAVDTLLKSDSHNYAAIMAILCRKEGELYDSKFENEILPSRIEMWEKLPVTRIMPIISFFFELWLVSQKNSQLYSMLEEAIDLTRKDIESSHKDGVLTKRSMNSLMKKLTKLEKSIKSI